jgi:PadR family transcriptional regulator, regulatory protein AphA
MSSLTPTARVIMGLLRLGAQTGYDIKRITDISTRFFWGASYGQIYPELKRLETVGLVRSKEEPRGGVRRRVYSLTPKGERAVRAWLLEPVESFELRDEGLLKLFFGEILSREELVGLVARRRAWYELIAREFRAIDEQLGEIDDPSGEVLRYGIELMDWNAAWFGKLERRLKSA